MFGLKNITIFQYHAEGTWLNSTAIFFFFPGGKQSTLSIIVRNCVCIFACKQTQTHTDTSACAYIYIYARAYARSIVYTPTQFAQTNSPTTRTRVYINNASNVMLKPYLHVYTYAHTYDTHVVDLEQYSQTNANERK